MATTTNYTIISELNFEMAATSALKIGPKS